MPEENPYSSPQSVVAAPPLRPPRPFSILFLQIILVVALSFFVFGFVSSLGFLLRPDFRIGYLWSVWGLHILVRILVACALSATLWAVTVRKSYGRWLGAAFLVLLDAFLFYTWVNPSPKPNVLPVPEYIGDPSAGRLTESLTNLVIIGSLLLWARAVATSEKSLLYFSAGVKK